MLTPQATLEPTAQTSMAPATFSAAAGIGLAAVNFLVIMGAAFLPERLLDAAFESIYASRQLAWLFSSYPSAGFLDTVPDSNGCSSFIFGQSIADAIFSGLWGGVVMGSLVLLVIACGVISDYLRLGHRPRLWFWAMVHSLFGLFAIACMLFGHRGPTFKYQDEVAEYDNRSGEWVVMNPGTKVDLPATLANIPLEMMGAAKYRIEGMGPQTNGHRFLSILFLSEFVMCAGVLWRMSAYWRANPA